jgi:fatty-acyl-CoA synthase
MPLAAAFAASRAGISAVWLNTAFSGPQLREVIEREGVDLLVHDAEFDELVGDLELRGGRLACCAGEGAAERIEDLLEAADPALPPIPGRPGRIVLLTSGTTGTPKGAPRTEPKSLTIPGAVLDRMPMGPREATIIGPPVFHGTGLMISLLSIGLGSKLVLRRRFDAAGLLDDVERHRVTTICVVPVMLQRVLSVEGERDTSSLKAIFCAGSQLPGEVANQALDRFGEVVYNLYGSTEVSVATLATPADLRADPTCVGRPALGARVRIFDEDGRPVPKGEVGTIYVGAVSPFEGYTGGGGKPVLEGLMASGDVGHFDPEGRLHIDGRDDEMIVSGGENVFPHEVEEILSSHPAVAEAVVIGVDDQEFGQRLRAFLVPAPGEEATADGIREFVKANLARYKVPRDVIFLDDLPRNPTGKVLKRQLPVD